MPKMFSTTRHISRLSSKGAVGNTAVTPTDKAEKSQGGNTPRISQIRKLKHIDAVDLGISKHNQIKDIRTKYYNLNNNNSKRVDNHNNNCSYSNYYSNSIRNRHQGHPSTTHRHTHTHTHTHTLTHTHTHWGMVVKQVKVSYTKIKNDTSKV